MNVSERPWLTYAILSAVAAAFVGVFGKVGTGDLDPTIATLVRSGVMTAFLAGVAWAAGAAAGPGGWSAKGLIAIALSGVAGAVSWLFYFKALRAGTVSQVAPIDKLSMPLAVLLAVVLLGDRPTRVNWLGIVLIAGGAYLAAWPRRG